MLVAAAGVLVGESPTLSDSKLSDVHNAFPPFGVFLFSVTFTSISLVLSLSTMRGLCMWSLTCGGLLAWADTCQICQVTWYEDRSPYEGLILIGNRVRVLSVGLTSTYTPGSSITYVLASVCYGFDSYRV
jgi:hypothetical protein